MKRQVSWSSKGPCNSWDQTCESSLSALGYLQSPKTKSNVGSETSVTVDGVERRDKAIPLANDRQEHSVEVSVPATVFNTEWLREGLKIWCAPEGIAPPTFRSVVIFAESDRRPI